MRDEGGEEKEGGEGEGMRREVRGEGMRRRREVRGEGMRRKREVRWTSQLLALVYIIQHCILERC